MSISGVSDVSLVGGSLLSADVAVVAVRPDVTAQRVFICRSRTGLVGTAASRPSHWYHQLKIAKFTFRPRSVARRRTRNYIPQ